VSAFVALLLAASDLTPPPAVEAAGIAGGFLLGFVLSESF